MSEDKEKKQHKSRKKPEKNRNIPRVSYTKGFYRFSKDFPSVTDNNGYRDNASSTNSAEKKASVRRRLCLLFIIIFAVSFSVTTVCFSMSKLPAEPLTQITGVSDNMPVKIDGYSAVFLDGSILSGSGVDSVIRNLSLCGVNAVLIEFKDADGYIYFDPSVSVSQDALTRAADNPTSVINSFKNSGFAVFAYVSCFADNIYARINRSEAAYIPAESNTAIQTDEDAVWYDGSPDSHAWISPYSDEVGYYLNTIVSDIQNMGVTGIILGNTVLPVQSSGTTPVFPGEEASDLSVNDEMASRVVYIKNSLNCRTGAVLKTEYAVNMMKSSIAPTIISANLDYYLLDARETVLPQSIQIGATVFNPNSDYNGFISELLSSMETFLKTNDYDSVIAPIIETGENSASVVELLASENADSYVMYDSQMEYLRTYFS